MKIGKSLRYKINNMRYALLAGEIDMPIWWSAFITEELCDGIDEGLSNIDDMIGHEMEGEE